MTDRATTHQAYQLRLSEAKYQDKDARLSARVSEPTAAMIREHQRWLEKHFAGKFGQSDALTDLVRRGIESRIADSYEGKLPDTHETWF